MKFTLETTVEVTLEFPDLETAVAWAEEHTVFDMLDRGAVVGPIDIYNANDKYVGRV